MRHEGLGSKLFRDEVPCAEASTNLVEETILGM